MELPDYIKLSKKRLLRVEIPDDDDVLYIEKYVNDYYGIANLDKLLKMIRVVYDESEQYYYTCKYRDAIAECLGFDMTLETDRDKLYALVNEEGRVRYSKKRESIGFRIDPEQIILKRHYEKLFMTQVACKKVDLEDPLASTRMALARTLTFIRIFPSRDDRSLPNADDFPKNNTLQNCWYFINEHTYFKEYNKINQRMLDEIKDRFFSELWIIPNNMGKFRRDREREIADSDSTFWFWPWVILKYFFTCTYKSQNHADGNSDNYIFFTEEVQGSLGLWSISDEF